MTKTNHHDRSHRALVRCLAKAERELREIKQNRARNKKKTSVRRKKRAKPVTQVGVFEYIRSLTSNKKADLKREISSIRQREGPKSVRFWLRKHTELITDWKANGHEGVQKRTATDSYVEYVLGGDYNVERGLPRGTREDNYKFQIYLKNSNMPDVLTFRQLLNSMPETKERGKWYNGVSLSKRFQFKLK